MMRCVDFLGNPASPHVRHWEMIMRRLDIEPVVHGIALHYQRKAVVKNARQVGPTWTSRIPVAAAYLVAGLSLRCKSFFKQEENQFVHAHNASGYGLSAWISGLSYGVTTYGTEIYAASQRGWVYRFVLRRILRRAKFITSTSRQMTDMLIRDFNVTQSKIYEFHLGVSALFFYSADKRNKKRKELNIEANECLWIANRRVHPLYHTRELVRAFKCYAAENPLGRLILLEGDADAKYLDEVKREIDGCDRITLISGFISQQELCGWLCAADFAISIPLSDQLSSSILEAMSCCAVPILGNLQAYGVIGEVAEFVDLQSADLTKSLYVMFVRTAQFDPNMKKKKGRAALELANKEFSIDSAGQSIKRLYEESVPENSNCGVI